MVVGRIARVLVMAVRRKLGIVTVTFAHENVDLARLQYPIEAGQLAEVDFERVRATLLAPLVAGAITSAGFVGRSFLTRMGQQDVLGLRRRSLFAIVVVVAVVVDRFGRQCLLFIGMSFDARFNSFFFFFLLRIADEQTELGAESQVAQRKTIASLTNDTDGQNVTV